MIEENRNLNTTWEGLNLIKIFEGFKATPYRCPGGYWTIGYGSTFYANGTKVRQTDPAISPKEAEALLEITVNEFEEAVKDLVRVPLNQNQFNALVSFVYNVGIRAFATSTLLKRINQKALKQIIAFEFSRWNKATRDGKLIALPGLTRRRKAEADLFNRK